MRGAYSIAKQHSDQVQPEDKVLCRNLSQRGGTVISNCCINNIKQYEQWEIRH